MADAPEPNHQFADSRRLTGPNRYFDGPAVTLTPLGPARDDPAALEGWAKRVRALASDLDWPDPQPLIERIVRHPSGKPDYRWAKEIALGGDERDTRTEPKAEDIDLPQPQVCRQIRNRERSILIGSRGGRV